MEPVGRNYLFCWAMVWYVIVEETKNGSSKTSAQALRGIKVQDI